MIIRNVEINTNTMRSAKTFQKTIFLVIFDKEFDYILKIIGKKDDLFLSTKPTKTQKR